MPVAFAVESGQADLLLISWLGIDRFNQDSVILLPVEIRIP